MNNRGEDHRGEENGIECLPPHIKTCRSGWALMRDNTALKLPTHFLTQEIRADFNSATIVIYKSFH